MLDEKNSIASKTKKKQNCKKSNLYRNYGLCLNSRKNLLYHYDYLISYFQQKSRAVTDSVCFSYCRAASKLKDNIQYSSAP